MGRVTTMRRIEAPVTRVFDAVAHVERFRQAVPDSVRAEFVSETRKGPGTRFRATRRMGKREATIELEVTEYVADESIRIVSDAGGIWDTTFRVADRGDGNTELTMAMANRPHELLARIFNPLIRPMVRKGVERDMDAVKVFCEAHGGTRRQTTLDHATTPTGLAHRSGDS